MTFSYGTIPLGSQARAAAFEWPGPLFSGFVAARIFTAAAPYSKLSTMIINPNPPMIAPEILCTHWSPA